MRRKVFVGLLVSILCVAIQAQAQHAPYAPFTAKQAELGKELAAKSLEIRRQITDVSVYVGRTFQAP